jgi:hypothetical protein
MTFVGGLDENSKQPSKKIDGSPAMGKRKNLAGATSRGNSSFAGYIRMYSEW